MKNIKFSNAKIWLNLGEALGCGGCEKITTVRSPFTCKVCGRMLCGDCGSLCKDHAKIVVRK